MTNRESALRNILSSFNPNATEEDIQSVISQMGTHLRTIPDDVKLAIMLCIADCHSNYTDDVKSKFSNLDLQLVLSKTIHLQDKVVHIEDVLKKAFDTIIEQDLLDESE